MLIALRTLFGSALGRIGGWIVAGLSVLAWLKWRDWSARREAKAEARTEQEIRNAHAAMDAAEISSRTRDDAARRELRRRHTRPD
jgi:type VI protein secretion system component VasK